MTAVTVDPRLRARRVAVKREEGRRRLRHLLIVLGAVASVGLLYGALRSPLLDVDGVTYRGLEHTSLDAVIAASGVHQGASLVGLDPGAVERRIEAVPWVETATVDRSWTGEVSIDITERVAVAAVMREQDMWVLVDGAGRVLTDSVTQLPDLPKLSGVVAAGEPGSFLSIDAAAPLRIAELLPSRLDHRVDGIYRDRLGDLWISMRTADRVLFGTDDNLALKVVAMVTVLEELDAREQRGWELDVSVATLPVVRELRVELRPVQGSNG